MNHCVPGYKLKIQKFCLYIGNEIIQKKHLYMGVSKNSGTPKWMVYNGKPYFFMDDLGVPFFLKHPYIPFQLHKPLLAIGTKPASPSGSPLASNTAVVRRPATSEPAKASVMDRTVVVSPRKGGNFAQNQNCPTKKPGRFTPTKRFENASLLAMVEGDVLGKKPGLRRISTGRCCFFLQSRSIIYHNFFPPKLCL